MLIHKINGIAINIGIKIQPARLPHRIRLRIATNTGIVKITQAVVPMAAFLIIVLPGEADVEPADIVLLHAASVGVVVRSPHYRLMGIGDEFRAAPTVHLLRFDIANNKNWKNN
jgi:hypothetical protein